MCGVRCFSSALLSCALLLTRPGLSAEWSTEKGLSLGMNFTDNVALTQSGDQKSDLTGKITPFVLLNRDGNRTDFSFSAKLEYLRFVRTEDDAFNPELSASSVTSLIRDKFFLDVGAEVRQTTIQTDTPIDDPLSRSGNSTTTYGYRINPYVNHSFGGIADLNIGYTYREDVSPDESIKDQFNQKVNLILSRAPKGDKLIWDIEGTYERTDFTTQQTFAKLSSATVSAGYFLNQDWLVFALGGNEWTRFSADETDARTDTWAAGFRWKPTGKISFDISYGEDSFGEKPLVKLAIDTKRTTMIVEWSRELARTVLFSDLSLPVSDIDTTANDVTATDFQLISNQKIVDERFSVVYKLKGRRSQLLLSGLYVTRENRDSGLKTESWSANVGLNRRLGRKIFVEASYGHREQLSEEQSPGFSENLLSFGVSLKL